MLRPLFVVLTLALLGCSSKEPNTAATEGSGPGESTKVEGPSAEGQLLYVNSVWIECEGEGPQRCLQVKSQEDAEWELHYSTIEGFTFEEGQRYVLRVESVENDAPPAGGSSRHWRLLEIVSKTPAP